MTTGELRRRMQATTLFVVSPVGALGALAPLTASPPLRNIPLGTMMVIVAGAALLLGVWLWRKKDPVVPIDAEIVMNQEAN